jgi:hypothetical protein
MAISDRILRVREIEDRWLRDPKDLPLELRADLVALAHMIREMDLETTQLLKFHRTAYDKLKLELAMVRKISPLMCQCKDDPKTCPVHLSTPDQTTS